MSNPESKMDDDTPQLSAQALAALQEFYDDQEKLRQENLRLSNSGKEIVTMPEENWQLSQFWYSEETSRRLADEALAVAGDMGKIACVSCPTLYHKLREVKPSSCQVCILEYDQRFQKFGSDFIPYDYNDPLAIPEDLKNKFDIVVADPPFLSEECLTKTAITVRYLTKHNILLCTGATMEELANRLLQVQPCNYLPSHTHNLANEFRCYANYTTTQLDGSR